MAHGDSRLFIALIAALISIPASVIGIVQLAGPVLRRAMSRRADKPAALPAPTEASPNTGVPSLTGGPYGPYASYLTASNFLRTVDFDARLATVPITIRYAPRCMPGL